jgi:hypothetical protein
MEAYYYEAYYLQLPLILQALNIVAWALMVLDMMDGCALQQENSVQVSRSMTDDPEEIFQPLSVISGILK